MPASASRARRSIGGSGPPARHVRGRPRRGQRADGHGGRCLRHARLLRDSQHPRHYRRRAAGEDSQAVPTQPAVERSRWDDQKDQQDWAPSMEEGGRLSSTGPCRERVLPVQVDSRRSTSKSDSRSASCRIGACVQRAQSNDRAWSTRVVRDRSVTNLRVGALGASFDLRNNAPKSARFTVPAHAAL